MAAYTWPTSLPQTPLNAGFGEALTANVIRTPMDSGPAMSRRRSELPVPFQVTFLMTATQVAALETFVADTLLYVRRFNWVHPRTLAAIEARIVADGEGQHYTLAPAGGIYWHVSMMIEVLP